MALVVVAVVMQCDSSGIGDSGDVAAVEAPAVAAVAEKSQQARIHRPSLLV
jgi:hypothetical protein